MHELPTRLVLGEQILGKPSCETAAVDMLMAFPYILLALAIVAALGPGLMNALIAVAAVNIPFFARNIRGVTVGLAGREFIDAAQAQAIGLVNTVCQPGELVETVTGLLDQILANGPLAVAHCIEELVVTHERPQLGWREWADRIFLHPWTGGPVMVAILGLLFWFVFKVGARIEARKERIQRMLAGGTGSERDGRH